MSAWSLHLLGGVLSPVQMPVCVQVISEIPTAENKWIYPQPSAWRKGVCMRKVPLGSCVWTHGVGAAVWEGNWTFQERSLPGGSMTLGEGSEVSYPGSTSCSSCVFSVRMKCEGSAFWLAVPPCPDGLYFSVYPSNRKGTNTQNILCVIIVIIGSWNMWNTLLLSVF